MTFISDFHFNDSTIVDFYIEDAGVLASCARAIRSGEYLVVDKVETHSSYRRKGLAGEILAAVNRLAVEMKVRRLILIATEMGIPLYLRNDYQHRCSLTVFSSSN